MGVVAFLQTYAVGFDFSLVALLMVIPLAATNAFIEEVIFRLPYVTMGDNETNSSVYGLIMGSAIFGIIHYWGVAPNGIFGVLISAYLGYFLAKSIQETKGFYWAFMIHFMLDVVILIFIFNVAT
ncbi:protease [Geomicrobium sp. JCM 19039]|nr:protease [Geomicrobium sp. JCM 19039]